MGWQGGGWQVSPAACTQQSGFLRIGCFYNRRYRMAAIRTGTAWRVVLVALVTMSGCVRTPPEQKLREALTSLQASVETRDASALEHWLAADFVGPEGLDREGARRLAHLMFLRHRDIGANLGPPQVTIQDRHATVRFTAALTGGTGGILPDAASVHDVDTAWRMEGGEWRLISAQWTERL